MRMDGVVVVKLKKGRNIGSISHHAESKLLKLTELVVVVVVVVVRPFLGDGE